jgi:hypothetical protein
VTVAREHITEVRDRQCSKGFPGPQRRGGGLSLSSEQWLVLKWDETTSTTWEAQSAMNGRTKK